MHALISTLIQSAAAEPLLATGQAPPGLLHPDEEAALAGLRLPQRRRQWLLGRWTAKHLVQHHLAEPGGGAPALARLLIANEAEGAPFAALGRVERRLPLSLSISHSGPLALAALWPGQDARIGADIERIGHSAAALQPFFSDEEQAFVRRQAAGQASQVATTIWSAKEAVLKALGRGMRLDPRLLICRFVAEPAPEEGWQDLGLRYDAALLPAAGRKETSIRVWWRVQGEYVQTVALYGSAAATRP